MSSSFSVGLVILAFLLLGEASHCDVCRNAKRRTDLFPASERLDEIHEWLCVYVGSLYFAFGLMATTPDNLKLKEILVQNQFLSFSLRHSRSAVILARHYAVTGRWL